MFFADEALYDKKGGITYGKFEGTDQRIAENR